MATLKDIIRNKRDEITLSKKHESIEELKEKIKTLPPTIDFLNYIRKTGINNIIAETKIKSPTSNLFNGKNMIDLAKYYTASDISAISVLTDKKYFAGSKQIMQEIRNLTAKPILRKDFIIDEYQIYESRAYGADAILLISSILSKEEMTKFIEISKNLGMECLVEFNKVEDLEKIPNTARIYGRNYRKINYDTDFSKEDNIYDDIYVSPTYNEKIPTHVVKVAESCIKSHKDITYLKGKGFNAFLIGTGITQTSNIKEKIEELIAP